MVLNLCVVLPALHLVVKAAGWSWVFWVIIVEVTEQLRAVGKVTGGVLGRVVIKSNLFYSILESLVVQAHCKDLLHFLFSLTININ